jgi:hypothetical protein
MSRFAPILVLSALFGVPGAHAAGRVLDGTPIALERAKTWCVAPSGALPNWDHPAHPECEMVWRVLAEKDGRILYSARYAWPSARPGLRVLTEVLFEGIPGSRVVHRLYAVQDDEAHIRLAPLRLLAVAGASVIESTVCMGETRECGRELAIWVPGHVEAVKDRTVAEIRSKLPKRYDLRMNPDLDVAALLGKGRAWFERDPDCCPSATIEFTLRLTAGELHVDTMKFQKREG